MDENRLRGSATDIGGKVKDAAGGLLGDNRLQAEGKMDQASGQLQNAYGSAKDTMREGADTSGAQLDSLLKERPMAAPLGAVGVGHVFACLMRR